MNKKNVLILMLLVPIVFCVIKVGIFVNNYQEKKFNANIENQLKAMYNKDFVVKEESSTEGVRWTVGLSKWKKTSYICYRKDIPEIEFEVDLDKTGKNVEADNYQRKRIEYEALQYYNPFFDAISNKYYVKTSIRFNEKARKNGQGNLLQEVDMPLYLKLHQKSFKDLIENYSDYISIGFAGRVYTDKNKIEIEDSIEKLALSLAKTKVNSISFSFGIFDSNVFTDYKTERSKGWDFKIEDKGFRGSSGEKSHGYWKQENKEELIKTIREDWKWQ